MYAKPLHLLQGMRRAQQGQAWVCVSRTCSLNEGLQIHDQHYIVHICSIRSTPLLSILAATTTLCTYMIAC